MLPSFQDELGRMLPDELPFPHFAEREAAWLLAERLPGAMRIADLRKGPLAPLLARPGVAEVLRACGDGRLTPERLLPLADPLHAFGRERLLAGDRAVEAAFDLACAAAWRMYSVSFTRWQHGATRDAYYWAQVSRRGGNLVLQVNFPETYGATFAHLFGADARSSIEYHGHPVRRDGPITMGWARLDMDPWGEDLLIEEIQTDWLRWLGTWRDRLLRRVPRVERADAQRFLDATHRDHARDWDRVVMLAVLSFAVRDLGIRRIWLHQPHSGAKLKRIHQGPLPPRSIYTDLPRRFGFQATDRAPDFLYRARSKAIANLRRSGKPVFWCLDLTTAASAGMRRAA